MTNWGATGGLIIGGLATLAKVYRAHKEGRSKFRAAQMCVTGWSFYEGEWKPEEMVFTIPVVTGAAVTLIATKVNYNRWTPTGANL